MSRTTMLGVQRSNRGLGTVRVFVAAEPEILSTVRSALASEASVQTVGSTSDADACLEQIAALRCDTLLVDAGLSQPSGIEVVRQLQVKHPGVASILLTTSREPAMLRSAMLAGARDCLVLPDQSYELVDAICKVTELERMRREALRKKRGACSPAMDRNGRLVVVCSAKGGTGKSFVATSLAVCIAEMKSDRSVALVDADIATGDIGLILDIEHSRSLMDLAGVAGELDSDTLESVARPYSANLHCYLAPDGSLPQVLGDMETVSMLVSALSRHHDLIIVNTGPLSCWPSVEFLSLADKVLAVTTPDLSSLRLCSRLRDAHEELGLSLEKIMVVVNQCMPEDALSVRRIGKLLGLPIAGSISHFGPLVRDLINRGYRSHRKRANELWGAFRHLAEKTLIREELI